MPPAERLVVVGASLAGVTLVDTVRRHGFTGRLTLIGAEPRAAYNRPALSKGVLAGTDALSDIALPSLSCEVDEIVGVAATALDPVRREIVLADGDRIGYDKLAVTTGARARRLSDLGAADPGVRETTFRDVDDARDLARRLGPGSEVVIVGAGILGMELASGCVRLGASVTLVDRQPPLRAQLGPLLADLLWAAAARHGVRFAHSPGGVRLRASDSGTPVVELADGRRFEGDIVLSAVGCVPEVEWLRSAGLAVDGGIAVDTRCRFTSDIVAAGDVAAFPTPLGPRRTPLWTNAFEQARTAAAALLEGESAPALVPSRTFWTEQFGMTVRVCGPLPMPGEPTVVAGTSSDGEVGDEGLLLRWPGHPGTAAAVNRRVPITRLRALTQPAPIT
ncbi:FAD-dependent oxidoreductase [Pseudonocardia kujensis]|uniref:NAD(P)/FAD-dependent oxidoreductase n=1 Tax=Pseudonocardia kujensis TaxID=1128675 RepID=UPI001E4078FE|nr:FAD-dependent oxidoreductase [Pseudonocardia kujensis]MCE0763322.1 FAD-dependent oxidoreductase [Pseudonocardia kujensis]